MKPSKKIKLKNKTPEGAVSAEVYYLDENGNPTRAENAVEAHVLELNSEGARVSEKHFLL